MAEIVNGIAETYILHFYAGAANGLGWALRMADGWWYFRLVLLQWRSWSLLQWLLWQQSPACRDG